MLKKERRECKFCGKETFNKYCDMNCANGTPTTERRNKYTNEDIKRIFFLKYKGYPTEFQIQYFREQGTLYSFPSRITNYQELRDYKNSIVESRAKSNTATKAILELEYPSWQKLSRITTAILLEKLPLKIVEDKTNLINLKDWYKNNNIEMPSNLRAVCYINKI